MWYGAVGSSWNADRKTVKLNPHMTKKRGVKRRSGKTESIAHDLPLPDDPFHAGDDAWCADDRNSVR